MTIVRLTMALLLVTVLASGCAYYYRITDTATGKVYYSRDFAREPNNVRFKDAKTGQEVALPASTVQPLSKEEYEAGLAR